MAPSSFRILGWALCRPHFTAGTASSERSAARPTTWLPRCCGEGAMRGLLLTSGLWVSTASSPSPSRSNLARGWGHSIVFLQPPGMPREAARRTSCRMALLILSDNTPLLVPEARELSSVSAKQTPQVPAGSLLLRVMLHAGQDK